jgi:hypothetical protein
MGDLTKVCPACGADKDRADFRRNAARPDGLSFYCKACFKTIDKAAYQRRRESKGFKVRPRVAAPAGWKWCPDCQDYSEHADFPRNAASRDGWHSYCKVHHVERGKRNYYPRNYGVTAAQIEEMIEVQAGLCLICLRELGDKPHVDHDHKTGDVRGVLCFNCNGGLGQFGDDSLLLKRAAGYLDGTMLAFLKGNEGVYRVATDGWRPGSPGVPAQPAG